MSLHECFHSWIKLLKDETKILTNWSLVDTHLHREASTQTWSLGLRSTVYSSNWTTVEALSQSYRWTITLSVRCNLSRLLPHQIASRLTSTPKTLSWGAAVAYRRKTSDSCPWITLSWLKSACNRRIRYRRRSKAFRLCKLKYLPSKAKMIDSQRGLSQIWRRQKSAVTELSWFLVNQTIVVK